MGRFLDLALLLFGFQAAGVFAQAADAVRSPATLTPLRRTTSQLTMIAVN